MLGVARNIFDEKPTLNISKAVNMIPKQNLIQFRYRMKTVWSWKMKTNIHVQSLENKLTFFSCVMFIAFILSTSMKLEKDIKNILSIPICNLPSDVFICHHCVERLETCVWCFCLWMIVDLWITEKTNKKAKKKNKLGKGIFMNLRWFNSTFALLKVWT